MAAGEAATGTETDAVAADTGLDTNFEIETDLFRFFISLTFFTFFCNTSYTCSTLNKEKTAIQSSLARAPYCLLQICNLIYKYQRERRGVLIEWKLGFDAGVLCGCLNVNAYTFFRVPHLRGVDARCSVASAVFA